MLDDNNTKLPSPLFNGLDRNRRMIKKAHIIVTGIYPNLTLQVYAYTCMKFALPECNIHIDNLCSCGRKLVIDLKTLSMTCLWLVF